jgi:antitoxin HigA-1
MGTPTSKRHASIEPSHPGEIIAVGLEDKGVTRIELARALGISRNTLYKLLEGRQGVTAEMAVRLAVVWGGSAEMWLGMQSDHDLWVARQRVDVTRLQRLRQVA